MSYTTVIRVWPGEKSETAEEFRNAWGSGPVIWNDMAIRYLRTVPYGYMACIEKLWPLANREDIPLHHRAVLAMTYDRMYVLKEHYPRAAEYIRLYLADFPQVKPLLTTGLLSLNYLRETLTVRQLGYGLPRSVRTHLLANGMMKRKSICSQTGRDTGVCLIIWMVLAFDFQ